MHETWTPIIAAHAAGATLAVALGGFLLLRRRKGDLLHRRIGRIWMADMYWVSLSSFGIRRLVPGHFSWIHGLSLWTIVSLTVAVWAAATHRVRTHRAWVVGSYFGLLGAGVAAVAFPVRLVPQTAVHHPVVLAAWLAALTVVAAVVIGLVARASGRRQPASDASYSAATRLGTHIRQASTTSSRISSGDNAANRAAAQL